MDFEYVRSAAIKAVVLVNNMHNIRERNMVENYAPDWCSDDLPDELEEKYILSSNGNNLTRLLMTPHHKKAILSSQLYLMILFRTASQRSLMELIMVRNQKIVLHLLNLIRSKVLIHSFSHLVMLKQEVDTDQHLAARVSIVF